MKEQTIFPREEHADVLFQKILADPWACDKLFETFCNDLFSNDELEDSLSADEFCQALFRAYRNRDLSAFLMAISKNTLFDLIRNSYLIPYRFNADGKTNPVIMTDENGVLLPEFKNCIHEKEYQHFREVYNHFDGKKKMYEFMSEFKDVFILELPHKQTEAALQYWKSEIIRFKEYLEKKFEVEITEEKLREAVRISNEGRRALKDFYELMKQDPAPMKGENLYNVLYGTTFKFDRSKVPAEIDALTVKLKEEYAAGKNEGKKHRILITGCPMGGATMKVVKAIEENGGVVVAFENCSGAKSVDRLIDENDPDIYEAIARRYLNIGCSVMTPNPNRFELLNELIDEYQVEAVVEMTLQACHTYNVEAGKVGRFVREEKKIPYLHVETDYSQSDVGQLNTRIAALIEML